MKTVAVYFTDPEPDGAPFVENGGEYARSYRELAAKVAALGARFCIARGPTTYLGKGRFSNYWEFDGTDFAAKNDILEPNVLLNKGEDLHFDDFDGVINDPEFDEICFKKELTQDILADVMPRAILVSSKQELERRIGEIPSDFVVAKPPHGALGRDVIIGPRATVLSHNHAYPLLLQEFIDTSDGIPGVMKGTHDSRLVVVGGEFSYCEYKIPKKGSLVSNVSLGGSYFPIPKDKIPPEELALARTVDAKFARFPSRIYSIDMCRGKNGRWYVIELNAPPGLIEHGGVPEFEQYHDMLAALLVREAA